MGATRRKAAPTGANVSSAALKQLAKAVEAMTDLGQKLDRAIFGRWDDEKNEEVPGLQQVVRKINDRIDQRDRRDKVIYIGFALLLCLSGASSLGVPTKQAGEAIGQAFWQYFATHPPTP